MNKLCKMIFCFLSIILAASLTVSCSGKVVKGDIEKEEGEDMVAMNKVNVGLGGGNLLQIANRSDTQMMSYLIKTPENKVVMIDGGNNNYQDAEYLYEKLIKYGGKVDAWFITHAHSDHYGALLWMMKNEPDFDEKIEIGTLYFSFPPTEWFKNVENGECYVNVQSFLKKVDEHKLKVKELIKGDTILCAGMSFEVLNDCRNYQNYYTVNDTSIAILAHYPKRDILFLADMGAAGGKDLINACGEKKLRCDIVQMAHHGQGGVEKEFYQIVKPKVCLYAAPDWLWENDTGDGENTGPYKTFETRGWMEELKVELSCPHAYGDYLLY